MEIDYENSTLDSINYNYNEEDIHSIFDWEELAPTIIGYGLTLVLGLVGNCLIIFTTFRYRRMHSVTNTFLSSLACSDLLLIIFCLPVRVAKLLSYTWEMGAFVCKGVHYMQNVSAICSVLTLTAISIERYYAIVHPIMAKDICTFSQAKKIICITWVSSILLASPTLMVQVHLPVGPHEEYFWCVRNWDNSLIWQLHEIYFLYLILVGPFCIMAYSYTLICIELCKIMERRSVMTSEHALTRQHTVQENPNGENFQSPETKRIRFENSRNDTMMVRQVVYMLVAVVLVFAICWAPLLIDNVLMAFHLVEYIRIGPLKYMSSAFHLMAYFNSCINPIIYGFMSKSFRQSFVKALCCSKKLNQATQMGSYSLRNYSRGGSQTRSTTR